MDPSFVRRLRIAFASLLLLTAPARVLAQDAQTHSRVDLVTISPIGWPDGRLDAEWLICGVTEGGHTDCGLRAGLRATTGRYNIGPQHVGRGMARRYRELDAVIRLDPSLDEGAHPSRWTFGLRAGLLHVDGGLPSPGLGVDVDRTWAIRRRLLIVAGAGMKGVLIVDSDPAFAAIPAARLGVGWVF